MTLKESVSELDCAIKNLLDEHRASEIDMDEAKMRLALAAKMLREGKT